MEQLKIQIKNNLCRSDGYINMTLINAIEQGSILHHDLVNEIHNCFPFNILLREKIYLCINDMLSVPVCLTCGGSVPFRGFRLGYKSFCSKACQSNNIDLINKRAETKKQRYGEDQKEIVEKRTKTNQLKYGVDYPLQNKTIRQQTLDTQENNGGIGFRNEKTRQKAQQTLIEKFGKPSGNAYVSNDIVALITKDYLIEQHHNNKLSLSFIADLVGTSVSFLRSKMNEYNLETRRYHTSSLERVIQDYLTQNNITFETNVRDIIKYELDIYIPKYNLAIECDGLWFHSERFGYDNNRHLIKQQLCEEKGIRLIHLFEVDFLTKEKIFNLLNGLLNLKPKIFARQCEIKLVSAQDEKQFNNLHHFQNHSNSHICLGLYFNDELVQLMSFVKPRFNVHFEYELLRLTCGDLNVVGGASKLFQYFIHTYKPSSIISYCNKRLFTGNVYYKLNMTFSHTTSPSYWYFNTKQDKLYHRSTFQKHKLKNLLNVFDESKSEWDNMKANNYNRIWDCGTNVFVWYPPFIPK